MQKKLTIIFTLLLILTSCSTISKNTQLTSHSFRVGGNFGGVVKNREIDGVSGATKTSYTVGYHNTIKFKNHKIETGLDFLNFNQQLYYNTIDYKGQRILKYSEFRFPTTYNFEVFKNKKFGNVIIKTGVSSGFRIIDKISSTGVMPKYTFKKMTFGLTLGFEKPIKLNNKFDISIFGDAVRTNKNYNDLYTEQSNIGGEFIINFGLLLKLKNNK